MVFVFASLFLSFQTLRSYATTSPPQTFYAHIETTMIGGDSYYLHKLSAADGPATILNASAGSTGRKLMGRWVYSLNGIVSIPASTWAVTYRVTRSSTATSVVVHADVDILIRKSDNTIRATIATNVANSPSISVVNVWETLTGTYNWPGYTVVDQTDYLEVAYYFEVITSQNGKYARLMVDDGTLPVADQTKVENVIFTYPNQAPVASFTFSPSNPLIYDTVTFNASASYDPDGSIVSYRWDFGDGNVTTVTNPIITHVYTTAASTVNYTVTLTVTDNEGSTGFTTQIVPVINPSILHVSLPAGTYVGPDPDNWLSQCWLLNITGLSETFTARIDDIHNSIESYDTHLIIALNNAAYQYLDNLTVGVTTIPKSSFVNGTPTPYGFTQTWEGDVYPTWFSDIYNGFGTIGPSSYKEAQVSVTFTNATGVRMHFDAYGSTDFPPPPTAKGHVTHNAHEKDSTVLFSPPAMVQYYLTVISPYGAVGGQGWYVSGSTAYASLDTGTVDHGNGTRRVFTNWGGDASGTNYAQSDPIFMDGPKTAIANWKTQYRLIVRTNGLGTYVTNVYNDMAVLGSATDTAPYIGWFDDGDLILLNIDSPIVDGSKRFAFTQWSGDATGTSRPAYVTMNTAKDITANYKTQYQITVTASPSGALGGTFKVSYTQCGTIYTNVQCITPWTEWVDASTDVTVSEPQDIINVSPDTRYKFDSYNPTASVTMDQAKTITLVYKTQYRLIMSTNFGTTSPSVGQHWYDADSVVPISATAPSVIDGEQYVWLGWTGTGTISYTGMDISASVTMKSPINQTAAWRHEYRLTMATNYGATTPSIGDHWYEAGSIVAISATPPSTIDGERYVWNGWTGTGTGSYTGTANPSSVTMNAPINETASWTHQFVLTLKTSGLPSAYPTKVYLGGLQVGTASDASPYTKWFNSGDSTGTIGVDNTVSGATGTRYVFVKWVEDSSTSNPRAAETMNSPKTFTALYKTQYYLTVNTVPSGLSPAPTPQSNWYDNSTNVELTAPSESYLGSIKYNFTYWDVDGTKVTGNPITVHMNQAHTATAHYVAPPPPSRPVGGFWEPAKLSIPSSDYTLFVTALVAIVAELVGTLVHLRKRSKKKQLMND